MSPTPPTLNPSQAVERIREIIVGRHLERLECRVSRLESAPASAALKSAPDAGVFEDRLLAAEARLEALHEHAQRFENGREDIERTAAMYREEAQRLAGQIQEVARERSAPAAAMQEVGNLERKLGAWLTEWQKSLNIRLETRDNELTERIRMELALMKDGLEKRFREMESKVPADLDERFGRIAAAARSFAEGAAFIPNHPPKHE